MKRGEWVAAGLLWALLLALAACGSARNGIEVSGALALLSLPTDTGAFYMTITNNTGQDDRLTGISAPGCGVVELHEMRMEGDMMTMRPVEGGEVRVPAGESVEFGPGGVHAMCLQKTGEFAVGDQVEVSLLFANAGEVVAGFEVIDPAGGVDSDG